MIRVDPCRILILTFFILQSFILLSSSTPLSASQRRALPVSRCARRDDDDDDDAAAAREWPLVHQSDYLAMANPWASRSLVSATEWETNRAVITDLYQNQNKTLKTVMEIMRDEYNFDATYVDPPLNCLT